MLTRKEFIDKMKPTWKIKGQALKLFRENYGFSMDEAGKKVGVSARTISSIEAGNPTRLYNIVKHSYYMIATIKELRERIEPPKTKKSFIELKEAIESIEAVETELLSDIHTDSNTSNIVGFDVLPNRDCWKCDTCDKICDRTIDKQKCKYESEELKLNSTLPF